ncbi:uncharacterized protein LOC110245882 [Exaiptasia diaphana]|uniref:Uncharacterized protein n=1 Tax=Exaiptasia diaphana TaxID=2652724 RepID=A0A913YN47_EXADI|nr:uncharacterized protein LOC110245882 [Exaiptasia diaphana]
MDPQFKNIENWEHFAFALGVPPVTIRTCKLYSECSPTIRLFKYLEVIKPDMTVGDLRAALTRNLERARFDLDRMLEDKLANECKVSEAITNSTSEILDKIALKLDSASPPTCTWIDFGLELGITRDTLKEFEMYTNYNPTEALFRCLYTASAKPLKASLIVGYFEEMDRQDILEVIKQTILSSDIDSKDAQDIFKLGSELLVTISRKLNEDCPGVGGWRVLASHLIADQYIDDPDIISKLEPPHQHEIHSPTKKIIEWLIANKPDFTIDELIAKCEEVGRNDAVKILIGHYSRAVDFGDDTTSRQIIVQETTKEKLWII